MRKAPGILIGLSLLFCTMNVQAQIHSPDQLPDSIPLPVRDSTLLPVADSISIVAPAGKKNGTQKQDSVPAKPLKPLDITSDNFFAPSYLFSPSPKKAVIFSAVFPGLGQIYNRKYWKLPVLYGGIAGLAYAITWNNGYYQDYLGAYKDIMDDNPDTNRWHDILPYGMDPITVDTEWFGSVLKKRKDYYRYYRDFSYIITALVYVASIIDAYVDAQLFDFDMTPDLSMRMSPVIFKEERSNKPGSSSLGLQFSFYF